MTDKTVSIDIRKDLFGANEAAASINAGLMKRRPVSTQISSESTVSEPLI
jgi:hypothetical protein